MEALHQSNVEESKDCPFMEADKKRQELNESKTRDAYQHLILQCSCPPQIQLMQTNCGYSSKSNNDGVYARISISLLSLHPSAVQHARLPVPFGYPLHNALDHHASNPASMRCFCLKVIQGAFREATMLSAF